MSLLIVESGVISSDCTFTEADLLCNKLPMLAMTNARSAETKIKSQGSRKRALTLVLKASRKLIPPKTDWTVAAKVLPGTSCWRKSTNAIRSMITKYSPMQINNIRHHQEKADFNSLPRFSPCLLRLITRKQANKKINVPNITRYWGKRVGGKT